MITVDAKGAFVPHNAVPRDERITVAALELLRIKGPGAVTVEAVAAHAGVAKTTIYRRFRNRQEMLTAALASIAQPLPPPTVSSARAILQWLIDQCFNVIEEGIGVGGVAALLTDEDPVFTTLIRSLLVEHRQALTKALKRESHGRQIRRDLDVGTILDCIVGAYLAERARSGTVKPGWSRRVLSALWPALTTSRAAK
jgi:AcrR family transcriptional regulator